MFKRSKVSTSYLLALGGIIEQGGNSTSFLMHSSFTNKAEVVRDKLNKNSCTVTLALHELRWLFFRVSRCLPPVFDFVLSLAEGTNAWHSKKNMACVSSFTAYLLRQSPSTIKRFLQSQKKLILSVKYTEWTEHAVESHVFNATDLLDLSAPVMAGGRGLLINTIATYKAYAAFRKCTTQPSKKMCCKFTNHTSTDFLQTWLL